VLRSEALLRRAGPAILSFELPPSSALPDASSLDLGPTEGDSDRLLMKEFFSVFLRASAPLRQLRFFRICVISSCNRRNLWTAYTP
jgi:hypothetical protein